MKQVKSLLATLVVVGFASNSAPLLAETLTVRVSCPENENVCTANFPNNPVEICPELDCSELFQPTFQLNGCTWQRSAYGAGGYGTYILPFRSIGACDFEEQYLTMTYRSSKRTYLPSSFLYK